MKQTLCPYSKTPLGVDGKVNREHVTPIAIGAPERFYVQSHEHLNSEWNEKIDSPFSNNTGIRFLAMRQGVKSRSGPIISIIDGEIVESGDSIKASLQNNGQLDIYHNTPVIKKDDGYLIKGYGDKAQKKFEKVKSNLSKKGNFSITDVRHSKLNNPTVKLNLDFDYRLCNLQLIKTAYLYTVWCLGDKAIVSENSNQYLQALNGEGIHSAKIKFFNEEKDFHQFCLFVLDNIAYCQVSLFGVLGGTFCTEINTGSPFFGQMTTIGLRDASCIEEKDQRKLQSLLYKAAMPTASHKSSYIKLNIF